MKIAALTVLTRPVGLVTLFGTLAVAHAQVTIDGTLNGQLAFGDPGPTGEQVVASFDASTSDKLIVVVSAEHSFGINTAFSIDGAEYGGRAMIEAVEENTLPGATALYYLDDPGPAGEVRVFSGMKNGGLVTIYAVSGTAPGVAATGRSTTASVGMTTTSSDSLVIAGILDGGQASNGNGAGAPTADQPMTQVHSAVWGGNLWGGHGSGYQIVAAPGPMTPTFSTLGATRLRTVAAAFESSGAIGTTYCTATPNSTGSAGSISASGSASAADNDVTLTTSGLPNAAYGFFITSRTQGFVANPNGSAGNLCVLGSIGPYVGPGQIQSTGSTGSIGLTLDLNQMPTPTGPVGVNPGDTWNFQVWHRDSSPTGPTSNFTDGLEISFF